MSTVEEIVAAVKALGPGDRQEVMEQLELLDGEISHEQWLAEWGDESVRRYEEFLESGEKAIPIEEVFALARARQSS
ncbi:MAG: hypothetical protein JNK60_09880 [Acidobacteria bacterium]|nr:hypothetical protein [Acidobacteriota bacterium]